MDPSLAQIYVHQQRERVALDTERYWSAHRSGSTQPRRHRRAWARRVFWWRRPYEGMATPNISSISTGAVQVG
jgi:hypothetical protein